MAKLLTTTWQEALKLARDTKIVKRPQVHDNGARVIFMLEDPTGQRFMLSIKGVAGIERNGNLLSLKESLDIAALELEPTDKWEDT